MTRAARNACCANASGRERSTSLSPPVLAKGPISGEAIVTRNGDDGDRGALRRLEVGFSRFLILVLSIIVFALLYSFPHDCGLINFGAPNPSIMFAAVI